jgi:hypothetical protein
MAEDSSIAGRSNRRRIRLRMIVFAPEEANLHKTAVGKQDCDFSDRRPNADGSSPAHNELMTGASPAKDQGLN